MSDASGLGPWHFLGIGTYNLVCLLLGMGVGWWVDDLAGSTPVLTLAGLAVGVAVGVLGTWVRVRPLLGGRDADEPNSADNGPGNEPSETPDDGPDQGTEDGT